MLTRGRSKQVQCNICLQPCVSMIGRIQCRHNYCFDCILKWSRISNTCPSCKAKILIILQFHVTSHPTLLAEHHKVESQESLRQESQILLSEPEVEEDSLDQDTPVFDSRRPRPFRSSFYGLL